GLVDIDIDKTTALRFAPWFLPKTSCVFGRASKPRSHWVYRVPESGRHKPFQCNGMVLEVRGDKHYTVFPGSIHETGEPIEFENRHNFDPAHTTWNELVRDAAKIAIAAELSEILVPGQ